MPVAVSVAVAVPRRLGLANAPIPSSASGVGLPSDIVLPVWLNVT